MEISEPEKYEKIICELNYKNRQLQTSNDYLLGKKINKYIRYLKKFDIKGFFMAISHSRRIKKADKLFNDHIYQRIDGVIPSPVELQEVGDYTVTVYTCIVGKYEMPKVPISCYKNYNYVLYSDQEFENTGCWELRKLPESLKTLKSNADINRYIKFHPSEFFDTDYSFYIDGNVELVSSINDFVNQINPETGLAMFDHPERNCLFREGQVCCYLKKGHTKELQIQMAKYDQEGMPHSFGLKEATVILSDLNNPMSSSLLSSWWDEYYKSNSGRDQLAFPYIIWKKGLQLNDIGSLGGNIREDLHLNIHYHGL